MKLSYCTMLLLTALFSSNSRALAEGTDFDLSSLANAVQPVVTYQSFQQVPRPIQAVAPRNSQWPPVSTSSVDFNVCDMPFTRDRGSSGIPMPDYNPNVNPNGGAGGSSGGNTGGTGGSGTGSGGGDTGTGGNNGSGGGGPAGYVTGAPAYRYMSNGAYMTGSGITVYPNGHRERGGPMFRYRSGYGFTDLNRPGMGYTWDRSAIYSYYQ